MSNKSYLQNALELNEEILALVIPLLTTVENKVDPNTHAMLRTVRRLSTTQNYELTKLSNNFE
ncbi:conserved hypothetical protein [Xenorhabdus bovienii str. oregonense]|uniref:Uncharacterized protein n=1 Tax=Xenorhabdus bovienii str. oregonense TaxID=1398202 RepID=A0A077PB82_XENBV|nr:hypothetical protein [Xenorhabdus bovienii]CDH07973.1 conserved hypothetical protein [Xenorhabdus bovienii str. oregonense]